MSNGFLDSGNPAFGHPGILPTWSTSSKEGVGTAYSTSSRVWFSLPRGILTEIYYPTIDRPQIRDAQFLVTDHETFFHEEKRDLPTTVVRLQSETLGFRTTSKDPEGRYTLTKEVISDPHQSCVLVNVKFAVGAQWQGKLQLYFLVAPHLEVGGVGNWVREVEFAGGQGRSGGEEHTYMAIGV